MKPERFTAVLFLLVIWTFMARVLFTYVSLKTKEVYPADMVKIKWEEIYPFEDGTQEAPAKEEPAKNPLLAKFEHIKAALTSYTSYSLPGYTKIVLAARTYEDIISWNMVSVFDYNAVMKLKDGYLTDYTMSLDVTHEGESVKEFADFCAECGIDFIYINFPAKVCKSEDKEISGVLDFANQNADNFLAMLKESGVRYYDFRDRLHEAGMNHHEAFYVTDHHWKAETGLWAAGEILKILRDDLSWDVDPGILSPENFRYEIYRGWFMGSQGRKLTAARVKREDFTMIYPKFETRLHVQMPAFNVNVSGDFTAFYDMRQLNEKDNDKISFYNAYAYGLQPLITADNELSTNTKRLVVIPDSFSQVVIPFLSLGVRHLDVVDMRYFTGSLKTFIKREKPDAVIVEYHSGMPGKFVKVLESKEAKRLYDFR